MNNVVDHISLSLLIYFINNVLAEYLMGNHFREKRGVK